MPSSRPPTERSGPRFWITLFLALAFVVALLLAQLCREPTTVESSAIPSLVAPARAEG